MYAIKTAGFAPAFAIALLFEAGLATRFSAAALTILPGDLNATKSGNDLVLSFSSTSSGLYTVQTSPDLLHWTSLQPGIPGDGTVKALTLSNALSNGNGFYRLLIQTPLKLLLPQSDAFAVLGHSCGGIKEQVYVTGFDPNDASLSGEVYLLTTCSTGGRGAPPATFTAWAGVSWDLAGNVISFGTLSNGVAVDPAFIAADGYGDTIFNLSAAAFLAVPIPAVPAGVTAVQSGDQFQISWTPQGINPAAVMSSVLTATPVNSTNSILTASVSGPSTNGVIASLQPQTTYQIIVVNTTISGSSSASVPILVTTSPATILPSAPTGVTASWSILDPTGATDTIVASWQAAVPGDSPIDQYQITITGSDGGGTFTQTVSGTTLTASFTVDYIPNWSVTVQAHNALGWGPPSTPVSLGGL